MREKPIAKKVLELDPPRFTRTSARVLARSIARLEADILKTLRLRLR
jgi:hypothetical protein